MMNQPELGKKILELRQEKGLTQSELAEICNLSLRTIQRTESAEVTPRSHTIKVILSNLDFDPKSNINSSGNQIPSSKSRFQKLVMDVQETSKLNSSTMKKLSVFLVFILLVVVGYFYIKEDNRKVQNIEGWVLRGSKPNSYAIGVDKSEYVTGESSAFLESK